MNDFGQSFAFSFPHLRNNNSNSLMVIAQSGSYITMPMLKNKYKGEMTNLNLTLHCLP